MGIRRKSIEKARKSIKKHLKQQKRRFEHIWTHLEASEQVNRHLRQGNHRFGAHIKGSDPGSRRGFGRVLDIERKDISGSRSAAFDLEIVSFGLRKQSFYPFSSFGNSHFVHFQGPEQGFCTYSRRKKVLISRANRRKTFQIQRNRLHNGLWMGSRGVLKASSPSNRRKKALKSIEKLQNPRKSFEIL